MTAYAITTDLMDGSKIRSGIDGVRVVRPGTDFDGATVIVVDLGLGGALDAALTTGARVIAYGSHVDDEVLSDAAARGAEAMPRSLFFRRLREGTILDRDG
ncbi:hypothetical protein [Actinospongicola halichondriae]|uniref:hypothetical protein n=1 Tax=Actinospongicola halichondriae TaxID=3236844 RepID=UPI003D56B3EE